jgi:replication factor C subunit 3/5
MAMGCINEDNVFKCSGEPSEKIFKSLIKKLMNNSFCETYEFIYKIRIEYSMSLIDLIKRIDKFIFNLSLSDEKLSDLITDLSEIETNLSNGGTDEIQIGSMIACFMKLRYKK